MTYFGVDVASNLVSNYFIATSEHWKGAILFWQIDTQGKVRTGKVLLNKPKPAVQQLVMVKPVEQHEQPKPESWEQEIAELENYFARITLPTQPIKLDNCSTITNCSLFFESHLAAVKANNSKPIFLPYLNRLKMLKKKVN